MDKYEFNIKVEQIKKMVTRGDFETSMKIADTIDWRRVRSANLLSMISQVYEKNGEYQEAKEVLLLAYERAPIGKRLLFKLTELALKEGSVREAEDYYREFCELAQGDSRQYLLRYMILKEKKVPIEQLIGCLEHYVSQELDERWMYELASLYEKAGQQHKCVQMCDRIMLMFAFGKYVDKAMDLKVRHAPLSEYQLDLMRNRDKYEAKLKVVEQKFDENTLGGYDEDEDSYLNSSDTSQPYGEDGYFQEQYPQEGYDQGEYAQGQYPQGAYNQEAYAQGQYPQEAYNQENYAQGQYSPEAYNQETYAQGQYSQGAYNQETYAQGQYPQGAYNQGTYTQGQYPQGAYNQETYVQGQYPQGAYNQETYAQGQYSQGGYNQETYAQGQYSQGGYNQETYTQGQYPQGTDNRGGYPQSQYPQGAYNQEGNAQGQYFQGAYNQETYPQGQNSGEGYNQEAYLQEGNIRRLYPQKQYAQEEDFQEQEVAQDSYFQRRYVPEGYPPVNMPQEQYPQEEHYQGQENYFTESENSRFSYNQDEMEIQEEISDVPGKVVSGETAYPEPEEENGGIDEELVVHFHQEDIEHKLAKEMSKISDQITIEQEPESMQTKVPQTGQSQIFRTSESQPEEEDDNIPLSSMPSYLLIEAKTPEKGIETAIKILKQIHAKKNTSHQVAKITGSRLNQKGIGNIVDVLAGKDLVVEEAGDLSKEELIALQQLVAEDTSGMNVLLIDNPRQLEELYQQNPELTTLFECISSEQSELLDSETAEEEQAPLQGENQEESQQGEKLDQSDGGSEIQPEDEVQAESEPQIDEVEPEQETESEPEEGTELQYEPEDKPEPKEELESDSDFEAEDQPEPEDDEEMDIDDFAEYATEYANKIDCSITGKSMLALYERIEIMEEDGIPLTKANAEDMIEEAADKAEKPPIGKLIKGMFTSKYDKEGLLILREDHFI